MQAVSRVPINEIHQGLLEQQLKAIFPNENTFVDSKKPSNLKYPNGNYLELDIWLPKLNISFEFQDAYHYVLAWYAHDAVGNVQQKGIKRVIAIQNGIDLIQVPCWWDGTLASLKSTICMTRPDLIGAIDVSPIPLNPPLNFFPASTIPDVGELMLASFPTDTKIQHSVSPNSWWIGEKYDGVRCCWNPKQSEVYTRTGREIPLPSTFKNGLPKDTFLDGEFWFGRGFFVNTYVLCKGITESVNWHQLRMVSFDVPSPYFQNFPFEERFRHLLSSFKATNPYIIAAPRVLCKDAKHLNSFIGGVIDDNGEGIMMRLKNSFYERGRSHSLIKLKTAVGDKEGLVVGVEQGSVILKLPSGHLITVPPSHVHMPRVPHKGEVVTFTYSQHARREVPVHVEIIRSRFDLSWDDVLANSIKEKKFLNEHSQTDTFTAQPPGYWTMENMKSFMVDFAKKLNLDPLLAQTWYTIPFDALYKTKGGRIIMHKFKGHYPALQALFPEVDLDNSAFNKSSWHKLSNRRKFFERFASRNGFDPLVADNWYQQHITKIKASKGASRVMFYHNGSVRQALCDLFPNIGLDRSKLWSSSKWHLEPYRRQFFEMYAKENEFDPLNPEHWYLQSRTKIMSSKNAYVVISHHKASLTRALLELFPEIGLDKSRLWNKTPSTVGRNEDYARREFFLSFAKNKGFDPYNPHNWYLQSRKDIIFTKGAKRIIKGFGGSVGRALMSVFPDIGLSRNLLWPSASWKEPEVRRKFFEAIAKENGFDPLVPNNWYSLSRDTVLSKKGAGTVLYYHKGSVSQALIDLFPDIGLDSSLLFSSPEDLVSFHEAKNRRMFFEKYASTHGFDPLDANSWYSHPQYKIMSTKGVYTILQYHGGNLSKALLELFPEINLDKTKFWTRVSWSDARTRRRFFEKYAEENNFNPLDPNEWYKHKNQVMTTKGASRIVQYHQRSIAQTLLDLFPEIGLNRSNLHTGPVWPERKTRRNFFEKYAKENNFDALIPDNWYSQSRTKLTNSKGGYMTIAYYKNGIPEALVDLFPEIGLDISKFSSRNS